MGRPWSLSSMWQELDGVQTPPWRCQLMYSEATPEALVLDFVALESCPSDAVGCPRSTPFSLHIGRSGIVDQAWDRTFGAWASAADLVTIVCGVTSSGGSWLRLSSGEQHLLLQI